MNDYSYFGSSDRVRERRSLAEMLAEREMSIQSALSPAPNETTGYVDRVIVRTGRTGLSIVKWMVDNNLFVSLPDWWKQGFYTGGTMGAEAGTATHHMNPEDKRREKFRVDYVPATVPLPATVSSFDLDMRQVDVSDNLSGGNTADEHITQATINVNKGSERMFLNGLTDQFGNAMKIRGHGIAGILSSNFTFDYPDLTGVTDINDIVDAIRAPVETLLAIRELDFDRIGIFFPSNYVSVLGKYNAVDRATVSSRLRGIGADLENVSVDIGLARELPDHRIVIIPNNRAVRLLRGQDPQDLKASSAFGMIEDHLVVACAVPYMDLVEGTNVVAVGNLE
jgi:hypothetical protein